MNAAIIVGETYDYDGMVVMVEAADEHEVVYLALNDQDAIDRGWGPTSYGTYEASSTPAAFARDAVMTATAPTDPPDGAVTQPDPAPSEVPSLVILAAEVAVIAAALAWDTRPSPDTGLDLHEAVREYREVTS